MRARCFGMSLRNYFVAVAAVYVCILATFVVSGCMTENRVRVIADQRQTALDSMLERDTQISNLREAIKQGAEAATNAVAIVSEGLDGLQDDLAKQIAEAEPGSAVWQENLVAFIGGLSDDRSKFLEIVNTANADLQDAESGWDIAEMIAGIATGFFPPAAIAVPMIRRGKRVADQLNLEFNGVIDAIAAGGGVVNAVDTRRAMNMIPGLKDRVTARRVEIGDKEMKAVKAT